MIQRTEENEKLEIPFEVFYFYIKGMIPNNIKWKVYFFIRYVINEEHPTGIYLPVTFEEKEAMEEKAAAWNLYNKIVNELQSHGCTDFSPIDFIIDNNPSAGFYFWTEKGFVPSQATIKKYMLEKFKISLFDSLEEMNNN